MSETKTRPAAVDSVALAPIVEELCGAACGLAGFAPGGRVSLPSREVVIRVIEDLRSVFFPGYFGTNDLHDESLHYFIGATLARAMRELEEQIRLAVAFDARHDFESCAHCASFAASATRAFLARMPEVRRLVASDVEAAYEGDPALRSRDEAIFAYPGIHAVTNQRVAHVLHENGVPLIPRIITEHAHAITGIDIHPGARIGERFFIDHGTGVVIGETTIIGARVRLYQGVTLGALRVEKYLARSRRHPTIEDDVVIYANATILGGETVIGRGSVIGGNVWLTHSVPPGSIVTHVAALERGPAQTVPAPDADI
jgi:serine O-acetyltransferase